MKVRTLAIACLSLLIFSAASAAENYVVTRQNDAPIKFKDGTLEINENSSLLRESIILNTPSSPVQINSASMKILYYNSSFRYRVETNVSTTASVSAVSIRHINYDVFGKHVVNLANIEIEDWQVGEHKTYGIWNAFGESSTNVLTTVTYISRVRLSDGTQWTFDEPQLLNALGSLRLEKLVGESKKEP